MTSPYRIMTATIIILMQAILNMGCTQLLYCSNTCNCYINRLVCELNMQSVGLFETVFFSVFQMPCHVHLSNYMWPLFCELSVRGAVICDSCLQNFDKYVTIPSTPRMSAGSCGFDMFTTASTLAGSACIQLWPITWPKNFGSALPNLHLARLKVHFSAVLKKEKLMYATTVNYRLSTA